MYYLPHYNLTSQKEIKSMQEVGLRTPPGDAAPAQAGEDRDIIAISTLDVLLPKPMVKLWIEMVVHATASMQDITGQANILPREEARIEADGSLVFRLRMPKKNGEVSMKVPMGMWSYRKALN